MRIDFESILGKLSYLFVYTGLLCATIFMLLGTYMSVAYTLFGVHFNVFN